VDRQLLERMIGAAVLVVVLILVVPAILTGPEQLPVPDTAPPDENENLRQLTIRPDDATPTPPVSRVAAAPDEATAPSDPVPKAGPTAAAAKPASEPEPKPQPKPQPDAKPAVAKTTPGPATTPKPVASPAPTPKAGSPKREAGWVVQLGSFASKPNAEGLASKVKAAGYPSYLVTLDRDGRTLYRVRVGPPDEQRSSAEQLAGRLERAGYSGQVTRQEAGG